ncbi:MAG: TonB-dependent receptor [Bacteroidota bacterium]|nr:TonB-dependent receptor [Bacteroidota bacterium]
MKKLITFFFFLSAVFACAQTPTQTVRGQIVDNQTRSQLVGVIVLLADTGVNMRNTTTDVDGTFRFENVTVGRHLLVFRYYGYKERAMNIVVTSGKETVLNVDMEESVVTAEEVVITDESEKSKPINEMATVSARSFTIEETSRYAGSLGDPSRMAQNYAGVSGADDSRNDVVIRGNSPLGVLWRLNGADIPNPNHFGSFGSTGGPVSMLNNNILDNSDFMTSAFPAEYGNATAGVFDLRMRKGNNEKFEFMGQVGFNGFEGGIEGPLSAKHKGSFLINYRFSSLVLFQKIGADFGVGDAIPKYQDLSFNLNFPTEKYGDFSIWGVGGLSFIALWDSKLDTTKLNLYDQGGYDTDYGTRTGMTGVTHSFIINSSTYSKLTIAFTGMQNLIRQDSFSRADNSKWRSYGSDFQQHKIAVNYMLLKKFNLRNTVKSGFSFIDIFVHLHDSFNYNVTQFQYIRNVDKTTQLIQAYSQWQHKFTDRLTLNLGVHAQLLTLNNSFALEPRAGLRWQSNEKNAISIGGGMHSQMQSIFTYFNQTFLPDGSYLLTNKNVGFSRAIHAVIADDWNFGKRMRLKAEVYYQYLYDIPVRSQSPVYSGLNEGGDFDAPGIDSLTNGGTGKNYGVELTIEKFYSKGYYFLLTTSLYRAYSTSWDKVERQTIFSGNYVVNLLGGKEFKLNTKNTIALDLKMNTAGGKRYVPIDFAASSLAGYAVYDYNRAYEKRYAAYFRIDAKIGWIHNGKNVTQQLSLEFLNATDHNNVFSQVYDPGSNTVNYNYQTGFLLVPSYKISF